MHQQQHYTLFKMKKSEIAVNPHFNLGYKIFVNLLLSTISKAYCSGPHPNDGKKKKKVLMSFIKFIVSAH